MPTNSPTPTLQLAGLNHPLAPPPLQLPSSPRFPARSPHNYLQYRSHYRRQYPDTLLSHNYLPTPPTISGGNYRELPDTNCSTSAKYRASHSVLFYLLP